VEHRRIVSGGGGAFKNLPKDATFYFDALVDILRFGDAPFKAEIQTDGLHQLRGAEGFVRERLDDRGREINIQFSEPSKGDLLKCRGSPVAHIDRRSLPRSSGLLRTTSSER